MSGAEISNQNYAYLGNGTLDRLNRFGVQTQDNVYDNQGRQQDIEITILLRGLAGMLSCASR